MQLTQIQRALGNFLKLIRKSSNRATAISKIIRVDFFFFRVGNVFVAHGIRTKINSPKHMLCVSALRVCEYNHYIHLEAGGQGANTYFKNDS